MIDRALVAQPGDDDLDLDIDGVTLTAVVRMGHEIWIRGVGGFGQFNSAGGGWETEPGDDECSETEVSLMVGFPTTPPENVDQYVSILETWRDRAVPLRICAAPGRLTTMIEDAGHWLPVPRGERPATDDLDVNPN